MVGRSTREPHDGSGRSNTDTINCVRDVWFSVGSLLYTVRGTYRTQECGVIGVSRSYSQPRVFW